MHIQPQSNIPLAPLTTWKIGGPAEFFWTPGNEQELLEALTWAREENLPIHVLGRGSNVLIADEGLRGLTICLRDFVGEEIVTEVGDGDTMILTAPSGMSLPRLSKTAGQFGFGGYEFYIGIPGTVGGAVTINAGYGPGDERQTANRCIDVRTVSLQGKTSWQPYTNFNPVYRHTDLVDSGLIVSAAKFQLTNRSNNEKIRSETAKHLAMRHDRQPLTRPTAGSVFKGTKDGTPAAVYIDRCGLKGLQVGGAVVSHKHANWIENRGDATARDVMELINNIQEIVREKSGVLLVEEVRYLY